MLGEGDGEGVTKQTRRRAEGGGVVATESSWTVAVVSVASGEARDEPVLVRSGEAIVAQDPESPCVRPTSCQLFVPEEVEGGRVESGRPYWS